MRDARPDEAALVADLIHELARIEDVESDVTARRCAPTSGAPTAASWSPSSPAVVVGALTWFVRPGLFHGGGWGCTSTSSSSRRRRAARASATRSSARSCGASRRRAAAKPPSRPSSTTKRAAALYRKHGLVDESLQLEKHF